MEEINSMYVSIIDNTNSKFVKLKVHFIENESSNTIFDKGEIQKLIGGYDTVVSFWPQSFQENNENQLLKIELDGERIILDDRPNNLPKIIHKKPELCDKVDRIINIHSIDFNEYIDLESDHIVSKIGSNIYDDKQKIYILNDLYLYGPFQMNKGNLKAKEGKNVFKFTYHPELNIQLNDETSIYIGELRNWLTEVDCMSTNQILDYCKEIVSITNKSRETINEFKKIAAQIIEDGSFLHQTRVRRIKNLVNQINFTQSEIEEIAQQKSVWNEIFSEMYKEQKELFIEAFRAQLNTEIASIEEQKHRTEEALNVANIKLLDIQQLIRENEFNLNRIKEKEHELIDNIKIQANIIGSSSYQKSNTFYERIESSKHITKNAIELIESNDLTLEEIEQQLFHELIPKEVYYTNNINATLNILKMLNDYCYYLVNVEIDWIKYESLFENGLKQIVNEACNNNERMHFLILNDFNIANIEFYGKPLIDVINKARSYIPGTNQPLPNNLKFILVETSCDNEEENFPTRCQSIYSQSVELDEILIINDLNRLSKELKGEALFNWNDFK